MHASRGAAALEQLFQFLNDHMRRHFETEEQLMRSSDYPGLLAHRRSTASSCRAFVRISPSMGAPVPARASP